MTIMKKTFKSELLRIKEKLKKELDSGEWKEERRVRYNRFKELLSLGKIDVLTEEEFGEIIKSLWASRMWSDKDYLVNSILERNGIELIRSSLRELLYGEEDLRTRFDHFSEKISGLGPSSITEILVFFRPNEYCLWNNKPKEVIPKLRLKQGLPDRVFKYQIRGKDYEIIQRVMGNLLDEMRDSGFSNADFLDFDIVMWMLFSEYQKEEPLVIEESVKELEKKTLKVQAVETSVFDENTFSHEDAEGLLIELGNILGYATYTPDKSKHSDYLGKNLGEISKLTEIPPFALERHLDTVRYIDVIWFREEFPAHCFEVEPTTGVSPGLLRLYQIRNFTNAKFFIVAPSGVITKFKKETSKDPFHQIKERYQFRSYLDLKEIYEKAKTYNEEKIKFFGKE